MLQRIYFARSRRKIVDKRYPVSIPRNSRLPLARPIPRTGPSSAATSGLFILVDSLVHNIPQYTHNALDAIYTRIGVYTEKSTLDNKFIGTRFDKSTVILSACFAGNYVLEYLKKNSPRKYDDTFFRHSRCYPRRLFSII